MYERSRPWSIVRGPGRRARAAARTAGAIRRLDGGPRVQSCPCGGSCPRCRGGSELVVGPPDDAFEREADAVADRVMRATQDEAAPATQGGTAAPDIVSASADAPGRPLPAAARAFFEARFGDDFSGVRVHTGDDAARSARDIDARAYTTGQDIVFGAGEFSPGTADGQWLIAHELTHTIQQSGGRPQSAGTTIDREGHTATGVTPDEALVIRRSEGDQPPATSAAAPREITAQDLKNALTGSSVQERATSVVTLFNVGDYMTGPTLLTLAGLPQTAPAAEEADRAAVRNVIGKITRIERIPTGFRIDLSEPEVVQKVKGFNFKIKNGATAQVDTSDPASLAVNLQDVKVQVVGFIDLPVVTLTGNKLVVLKIPLSLVKEKEEAPAPAPVQPVRRKPVPQPRRALPCRAVLRTAPTRVQRVTPREIGAGLSAPFGVPVVLELQGDALDRASAWAARTWPESRPLRVQSLNKGLADAMRHAYWSACMTVALGEKQAARFATAHEVPVERLSGEEAMLAEMDLFNNEVGRTLGLAYVEGLSAAGESPPRRLDDLTREDLWDAVTWARIRGDLKAVRIDPDGTAHLVMTDDPLAF